MIHLPSSLWGQALVTLGLLFVTKLMLDVFFSRLRSIPGPVLAKTTNFWRAFHAYGGRIDLKNVQLQLEYEDLWD